MVVKDYLSDHEMGLPTVIAFRAEC